MTLRDTDKVDMVGRSPADEAVLFMVQEVPWGFEHGQLDDLLAKVNTYWHYLVGGQFASDWPDLATLPKVIRLECASEPTPKVQEMIDTTMQAFAAHGIEFGAFVSPALQPSD